jgi:hypothetical protein
MKKVIQFASFLAIAFVLSAVNIYAQGITRIDADIPFDFVVGDKMFEAGKYVLRIQRQASGARTVDLYDNKGRVLHSAFALENGDTARGEANLGFDKIAGVNTLTKIRLDSKGYNVPAEERNVQIAAARKDKDTQRN